jgi:hypothetical protein
MAFKANGQASQGKSAARSKKGDAYTHLWRTKDSDFPCTPTGVEGPPKNGRAYVQVKTPDGHEGYVPRDELILRPTQAIPQPLSAEDIARLDTWACELAAQVHGDGREEASGDWRFAADDSLVIHPNNYWHDFRASIGGHGALSLSAQPCGDRQGVRVAHWRTR